MAFSNKKQKNSPLDSISRNLFWLDFFRVDLNPYFEAVFILRHLLARKRLRDLILMRMKEHSPWKTMDGYHIFHMNCNYLMGKSWKITSWTLSCGRMSCCYHQWLFEFFKLMVFFVINLWFMVDAIYKLIHVTLKSWLKNDFSFNYHFPKVNFLFLQGYRKTCSMVCFRWISGFVRNTLFFFLLYFWDFFFALFIY